MNDSRRVFLTVAGTRYRFGNDVFRPGQRLRLVKEPDNAHDREAIRVEMEGLGLVGYVANSVGTRVGESWSAGRLYDRIGRTAVCHVAYVLRDSVLCALRL